MDATVIRTRKSQDTGALFESNASASIQKISEKKRAVILPQISPQIRLSRPLFFLTEAKPPKNADAYIAKSEIGLKSE